MEKISEKMLEVIKIIHKRGGVASAHEIYEESKKQSKIAYVTIQKYLKELEGMNIVVSLEKHPERIKGKKSKIIRYSLNYDFLHSEDVN